MVTQTPFNLDLIEAFIGPWGCGNPKNLAFNWYLFQAEGSLIRDLLAREAQAPRSTALVTLLKGVTEGNVSPVSTLRLSTRGGQRATAQQVQEHFFITGLPDEESGNVTEMRPVGTRMELDPTVGPDGFTIDVNFWPEHHTAPPFYREENLMPTGSDKVGKNIPLTDFYSESIKTSLTMAGESSVIMSVWKPTGKPEIEGKDILHISILEAQIIQE